ncbi:unnamed protein product [Cylicocyclus nassatus]|uniref:Apple domain-containing protein n=1 Tax=Cylicocyclus nassatus TaxID=53992 RepID=A0AA36GPT2_CYLNA|nr:unnamed protein product [Cylicocyclus nassatus]
MCFVTLPTGLIWLLMGMQVQQASGCTFTPHQGEFAASFKYEMLKKSEPECLQVCYEEPDCTFAHFVQLITGVCTIYKNGSETQNVTGVVYSIDRQLVIPNCQQPLPVASKVENPQNISELVINQNEAELDSLFDQNVTSIYAFYHARRWFYSQNASLFPDGTKPDRKFIFAREPQPGCSSLPVFTTASGRIYIGKVYNVTGYTFMHAYAFADVCRSIACAGTCCGTMPVHSTGSGYLDVGSHRTPIFYMVDVINFSKGLSYDSYRVPC